jgi:hypothetical protein
MVIELFYVTVHKNRAPERAQGLGSRLGRAGWGFFENLFELRKVRPHRVILGQHRSASAGEIYLLGSRAHVNAGLLKTVLGVFYSSVRKLRKNIVLRASFVFNSHVCRCV